MPGHRLPSLLIVLGLLQARQAAAEPAFRATVLSIGDGDTLRVRSGQERITVRLACIDAPETAQSPYGQKARQVLQWRLPVGQSVTIQPRSSDRFGRTVAEVISDTNINLALVEDGLAFAYRRYLAACDGAAYLEAEERARRQRLGVWRVPGGITRPWDFRRGRRSERIPDATTPDGSRHFCSQIGSHAGAQELMRQDHSYLDSDGDGEACESLR
ncbi:thermonuclease family protein [Cyanobium sp. AMD-g]|uniref:thermonuclease family protein n=1 Tax=Cyanobium sp. AMD-g TaxID=2823699 RepID=UPI0020CE4004|nr:thermonuclease family protein [Cyanobium sp. AMD-g]MCP9931752.1 thermonuclease family protein [Cyanobium sp. AMD-g]